MTSNLPLFAALGDPEPVEDASQNRRRRSDAQLALSALSRRMELIAAVDRLERALRENTAARLALIRLRKTVTHD
jgi:hypothetical protein